MTQEASAELWREIKRLRSELTDRDAASPYRGTKSSDFTTADLPQHGDYGYQTTANEIQINCNGAIRAISTSAV